jgi:sodium/hydrogen exchanger 8
MFEDCKQSCVQSIERIFCAGMCSPDQAKFLKFDAKSYAHGEGAVLKVSNKLCSTVFQACQDATDTHGNVYRYKYKEKARAWERKGQEKQLPKADQAQYDSGKRYMAYSFFMAQELELSFVNQYSQTGVPLKMRIECVGTEDVDSNAALTEDRLTNIDGDNEGFTFVQYCTSDHNAVAAGKLIVFLLMLIVSMHFANILSQHHILWFPESGVYLIVGMFVAFVMLLADPKGAPSILNLDAEMLNLLLLPPIIFEAGYELKSQLNYFHTNIVAILSFAIVGTLISTLIVGLSLDAIFEHIGTLEALMFGSLISAVDPVATLATFAHVHVNPNLETIVFGESLVNDAMAIVLYRTFKFCLKENITKTTDIVMYAGKEFFLTSLGSSCIGVLLGICSMVYFRYTSFQGNTDMQALVLIFSAYCSFLLAENWHLSGILATLVCAVWCAVFTDRNLSEIGDDKTHTLSKQFAGLAELTLFILAGMMTCLFTVGGKEPHGEDFGIKDTDGYFFLATLGLILVARVASLWPIAWILNKIDGLDGHKTRHLSNKNLLMMWVSGLRGAIAIGLAMDLPTPHRYTMLTTTCIIVLFTTFVMGSRTPQMLKLLKIETGHGSKRDSPHPETTGMLALVLRPVKVKDSETDMRARDEYTRATENARSSTTDVMQKAEEKKMVV